MLSQYSSSHDAIGNLRLATKHPQESSNLDQYDRFYYLSHDLFCIADMDGNILRVNPAFGVILGHSDDEVLLRPFLELVHPDDLVATAAAWGRLQEGVSVVRFRNRCCGSSGRYCVLEWTFTAENGLVYAVARDLSGQLSLEEEVVNHRRREREILDNTPAVIYVKGIDHRYQFVNRQFADFFRVAPDAVIGKTESCLFPPNVAEKLIANHDEVLRTRGAITVEEHVPHDDGVHTYISIKFPLFDSRGEIAAVAGISTDISDRIRAQAAEQELQLAQVFQRTLYPSHAPEIPGLEIAGASFPVSQVCGDYYDFIPLGQQRVAISLGDVAGHGYKPALQMVELRTSLRIMLRKMGVLQGIVEELNDQLCDDFAAVPSFVSLFLASIDVADRSLRYLAAGHQGFILKADGRTLPLESTGMVLGVVPGTAIQEVGPIPWESGDVLAVFTDGFNEAANSLDEQFGTPCVLECLAQKRTESARAMIDHLFQCVKQHAGNILLQDDMTVVVVKATM
jgi:PAS domain S-box-containing protein